MKSPWRCAESVSQLETDFTNVHVHDWLLNALIKRNKYRIPQVCHCMFFIVDCKHLSVEDLGDRTKGRGAEIQSVNVSCIDH